MTMLSFRVDDGEAAKVNEWAERLQTDRSHLLRAALREYLDRLASETDAEVWSRHPRTADESEIAAVAEWGPAEDWSDWADA